MTRIVVRYALRSLSGLIGRVPPARLGIILAAIAVRRARSLVPADGLRFLFSLDTALYREQGRLAVTYGGGVHTKHRHTRYHDFFVRRVHSEDRVLDIGCGNGALAHDVAEKAGARVWGIDLSDANIHIANERYSHPRVHYSVGNALVKLPADRFDAVIMSNVLEHMADRPQFLRRLQATARPSRILIRVPLFERDWRVPLRKELGTEWRLDSTHETEYTLESFADEIAGAGMSIVHQEVRWGEIWAEVSSDAT